MSIEPDDQSDQRFSGLNIGCACQIVFFVLGWAAAAMAKGKLANAIFVSWGYTQWLAIIPLFVHYHRRHMPKTAQGLLISGCLGILLSSACAAMMFNN